ncbi:hypothetical protein [Natronomonas marina]|jgi:hypothetical protein|uniref:hypothetical protein n=1 Tax=Natronomonas marina TaxID=2961939 RepID=UPI0020CA112E|nr:hypothetical protein [Natronomonas marina]
MAPTDAATRLVVSYPADLSDWGRMQLERPEFRAFLRKTHESAEPGDVWEEFVGVGCCGDALDVPLRVERVEGGPRLAAATAVEFEERAACGIEGGWLVQSEAAPD